MRTRRWAGLPPRLRWFALLLALVSGCALNPRGDEPPETEAVGFPPFYRRAVYENKTRTNVLFPIYRELETPERSGILVFPIFWKREFLIDEDTTEMDWVLLPFLFGGTESDGEDHFLFFPFWGESRDMLGKDRMRFRFFPLYLDAVHGEYESGHALWPLISWGEGDGRSDFRILPFYARDDHEGKSWSRSVLWPFLSWGQESLDTEHPVDQFFFFPFYGRSSSDVHSSTTVLFPFFSLSDNDAGFTEVNAPWPFYRNMRASEDRYAYRLWPLFGRLRDDDEEEDWFLWPLFWRTKYVLPEGAVLTHSFVPFYRNTAYLSDPKSEEADRGRQVQVWPLFRRIRDDRGAVYFRTFALLPFNGMTDVKANLGWLWTLFEYYEDEETEKAELLSGLLGYESGADGGHIRLLWFLDIPY
jgi:hypothetical protein